MDLSDLNPNLNPDQEQCVRCLDKPLLICAGAGSGKTQTLTDRITWALSPGSAGEGRAYLESIDQALIITFTEKAASEIKARIRSSLRLQGTPHLMREALKVDGAWISTIHGMCSRILHTHALELGLDPAFSVANSVQDDEMLVDALALAMEQSNGEQAEQLEALLDTYSTDSKGMSVGSAVRDLLTIAQRCTQGLEALDCGPKLQDMSSYPRRLLEVMEDTCAELEASSGSGKVFDKARISLPDNVEHLKAYLKQNDSFEIERFSFLMDLLYAPPTNIGSADSPLKKSLVEARDLYDEAALLCPLALGKQNLEWLISLTRRVQKIYTEIKAESGLVTNADLITLTLSALDSHPAIAERYKNVFKLVMVDEFQDTSQLQIDLIEHLTGKNNERLCTVGDSQQSIYRFQGADVNVYLQHKKDMQTTRVGALLKELHQNYRSHPDILSFVRKVCGQPGFFAESFLDLSAEKSGKPYYGNDPRIDVVLTTYPYRGGNAKVADARYYEAQAIAQRFARLKEQGQNPEDMVILMAKTTGMDVYAQALRDAGLECLVTGGSKFYENPEVQLCVHLLSALANPADTQSLFAVLSGQMWNISSQDFLFLATRDNPDKGTVERCRMNEKFMNWSLGDEEPSPRLVHIHEVFKRAWKKSGTLLPSQLVMQVIVESGWLARMEAGGVNGQAQAGNVIKFIRLVQQIEEDGDKGLAATARTMEELSTGEKEKPGTLMGGKNAVRIMTIHASKGLQFPIVAVVNAFERPMARKGIANKMEGATCKVALLPSKIKASSDADDFAATNPNDPIRWAADLKQSIDKEEAMERQRLLYVALTRASAALIVTLHHYTTKDGVSYSGLSEYLLSALCKGQPDLPAASCTIDYGGTEPCTFTRIDADALVKKYLDDESETEDVPADVLQDNFSSDYPLPVLEDIPQQEIVSAPSLRTDFFSYSSIAHGQDPQPVIPWSPADEDEENDVLFCRPATKTPGKNGADADKATEFGTALHRCAEWMALQHAVPKDNELDDALRRIARTYAIKDRDRLERAAYAWAKSDPCKKAFTFPLHHPEVAFSCLVDKEVLEGEIDLLCLDDSGSAFIIDYKTGGSPDETPQELYEKHLLQAQCYAYAVMQTGYSTVDLNFVRVEQADPQNPDQPQTVSYSFSTDDAPILLETIRTARAEALKLAY